MKDYIIGNHEFTILNPKCKCRWCGWETLRFRKSKKGKTLSGYPILKRHVEFKHPEEYAKLLKEHPEILEVMRADDANFLIGKVLSIKMTCPDYKEGCTNEECHYFDKTCHQNCDKYDWDF